MASKITQVLVYNGKGANQTGCHQLFNTLKSLLDSSKHRVDFITPDTFINEFDGQNVDLIAFGGGYTSGFEKALGKAGLQRLRDYVLQGGSYLGLGAGGYFGCDYIEFDKGGPLEKFSERDLRFYPGIGIGPAYPGFKYLTNEGVQSAPVTVAPPLMDSETFNSFIDGGGMFKLSNPVKPGSHVTQTKILARFEELPEKPAAVVMANVGKGRAILSGVHLEYDTLAIVDADPELKHFRERFETSVQVQRAAFAAILRLLKLTLHLEDSH